MEQAFFANFVLQAMNGLVQDLGTILGIPCDIQLLLQLCLHSYALTFCDQALRYMADFQTHLKLNRVHS